jgi:hypothetical protein
MFQYSIHTYYIYKMQVGFSTIRIGGFYHSHLELEGGGGGKKILKGTKPK